MAGVILIVEDCPESASNLEIALAALPGTEVAVAASGLEAWRYLDATPLRDVVALVTDLEMPRMNGFELIERVRADPRFLRLPIIVLSGATDPAAPDLVRRLGASAYFPKPYSPGEVRNQLERLLNDKSR